MDFVVLILVDKVHAPSILPLQMRFLLEIHGIGVRNSQSGVVRINRWLRIGGRSGRVRLKRKLQTRIRVLDIQRNSSVIPVSSLNALGVDLETNNDLLAAVAGLARSAMVTDDKCNVVIDEVACYVGLRVHIFIAKLESSCVVLARFVGLDKCGGAWEIVHDPLCHVAISDDLPGPLNASLVDFDAAKVVCLIIRAHYQLIVGQCDSIAPKDFAKTQGHRGAAMEKGARVAASAGRTYERQLRVGKGQLGVVRVDFVCVQGDELAIAVAFDRPAYQTISKQPNGVGDAGPG